ncbi:hypothetical protein [Psychroflexus planctonicus]|uniref:Lipoprotein n=1 Tax=Psychroflexus planctonicus TaxID=1526575 RepID=A0ABQ1SC70_9FLAO|nr:hypothetical protein [Psychroflexus planctonicus]GGE27094.1 hypothetical protein GCM10010832_04790 [Psychroflexus planctonicus]
MNKIFYLFAIAFVLTACKNEKEQDKTKAIDEQPNDVELEITEPELEDIPSLKKCYTYKDENTDAQLNLILEDDIVTGNLIYNGENSKSGSLTGEFSGDTLYLSYKYRQGDVTSVKEIVFLEDKKNFTLQQGSAKLVEKNEFKTIQDRSKIKFDGWVYKKLDCEQEKI